MQLIVNSDLNPVDAYRRHGRRFAIFVAAKLMFIAAVVTLSMLTLLASVASDAVLSTYYAVAIFIVKATGVIMPFLAFEAIYWWLRLRRQGVVRHQNQCHD